MDTKQQNRFFKDIKLVAGVNDEQAEAILLQVVSAYEKGQKDAADQIAKLAGSMYKKS